MPNSSLADALMTNTQQRLYGLLFGQPERSFFVTELIELAEVGRGAVQRELSRLERSGLVTTERRGAQKHYRANPDSPVFAELCSIVTKTIGVEVQVRAALSSIRDKVVFAAIYGSIAKQSDRASSDIDLLLVANDLELEQTYAVLAEAEKKLGRQISPTLLTVAEFESKKTQEDSFVRRVLSGPLILLFGDVDAYSAA